MIDSLTHIIDSLKHSQIVINNLAPEKPFLEVYSPYIAVLVSIIAIMVNYSLIKRQMQENSINSIAQFKNSIRILEINIKANREDMMKEYLLNYCLSDFQSLRGIYKEFKELCYEVDNLFQNKKDESTEGKKKIKYFIEVKDDYRDTLFRIANNFDRKSIAFKDYSDLSMNLEMLDYYTGEYDGYIYNTKDFNSEFKQLDILHRKFIESARNLLIPVNNYLK